MYIRRLKDLREDNDIKKYIIPLIDNELKKEKYDKARLTHILLSIDNIN